MSSWSARAACKGQHSTLFFVDDIKRNSKARNQIVGNVAYKFCDACPVAVECLREAISMRDTYSVRGGSDGYVRSFSRMGSRVIMVGDGS